MEEFVPRLPFLADIFQFLLGRPEEGDCRIVHFGSRLFILWHADIETHTFIKVSTKIVSMEIIIIALLVVFIAAAHQDYRKREVSDWITAIAWLLSAFVFNTQTFIFFFVGAWILAQASELFFKQNPLGFGDILWLPIFASLVNSFGGNGLLTSLVAMLFAEVYLGYEIAWKKTPAEKLRGSPFVLVLLIMLPLTYGLHLLGI